MVMTGRIHSLESFGTVDGPGVRFVVFFQGCPMRCQFCHNPDTWSPALGGDDAVVEKTNVNGQTSGVKNVSASGRGEWTPSDLLAEVERYRNFIRTGGVTATGGEPLMQSRFLAEFFRLCREAGFHTCLDTSGCYFNDEVKLALEQCDLVMLDIKTTDDSLHKILTGMERSHNALFMDYLQETGKPTWVRHVVTPGINDDDVHLTEVARYVARYSVVERVELLPYHTMGEQKYQSLGIPYPLHDVPGLTREQAEHARSIFRQYVTCKVQ